MRLFTGIFIVLTISSIKILAQFNYNNSWKKIETLEEKGLSRSALEAAKVVYAQAVKDKSEVQQIKALIYQMKYNAMINDSSDMQNLQLIDQQIVAAKGAQQAILQSIKAEMLLRYLQRNRYKFYDRTAIAEEEGKDISAWSLERLNREITGCYLRSLSAKDLLQKTSLAAFDPILIKGNTRPLRSFLYDLLAHRALNYFTSGEVAITQPTNQFELEEEVAFAPATAFAVHRFHNKDTAALQYRALVLFQELIRLHANNKEALLDVDVERVAYVYTVAVMDDKDALYFQALERMALDYADQKELASVWQLQAAYYQMKSRLETTGKGEALKKAKALCEKAIRSAPASVGGVACARMLDEIMQQSLELNTEKVNVPGQPFRTLVRYKNINKIYLHIVKIDETFLKTLKEIQNNYYDQDNRYWKLILSRAAWKTWKQLLPDPQDFLLHKAEIKIDALPIGHYMLLSSVDSLFNLKNNPIAMQLFWVSNISYINDNLTYYALDRTSGKPLAGAQLWVMKKSDNAVAEDWILHQSLTTAKDGRVEVAANTKNAQLRLQWKYQQDELYIDEYKYFYTVKNEDSPAPIKTFLFADRSMYRPGQTIYFKGIVLKQRAGESLSDVLTGFQTTVYLLDANREKVDSFQANTNDYGSYTGKFILPEGYMNGSYSLQDNLANGFLSFQVEAYKQPKFYVAFDTVKNNYRLGDTVITVAKAMAYAGNLVNGAKVKYRVERSIRYPYPWLLKGIVYPFGSFREIAHGETLTDANGAFVVKFPALPDKSTDRANQPVFTYRVYADVTDLNGETRSAELPVSIGWQSLEIIAELPQRIQLQDLQKLKIHTKNLNGVFEKAWLNIQLKPLEPVKRLLRPRYWEKPDQFVMKEAEYIQAFPVDLYNEEDKQQNWPQHAAVMQENINSTPDGKAVLNVEKLSPGFYELEISAKDKTGELVVQKITFELIDVKAKALQTPAYIWTYQSAVEVQPGNPATIYVATTIKDLNVLHTIQHLDSNVNRTNLNFAGVTELAYPVMENDRGGILVSYTFVKDNRLFSAQQQIQVPWDNKTLQVKLGTHRDKLLPGEKEKWTVMLSGNKKEKVAAEMLASMYDASLNAFAPHQWQVPDIYSHISATRQFEGGGNFKMEISAGWYLPKEKKYKQVNKSYDQLNLSDWLAMQDGNIFGRNYKGQLITGNHVNAGFPVTAMHRSAKQPAFNDGLLYAAPAPAEQESDATATVGQTGVKYTKDVYNTIPLRKNFQETAFFFPDLHTDKNGTINFEFTVPESLTQWNFQGLAHTKDLSFGIINTSIVTQKILMVQPNTPRFVREGDKLVFTAKVSNLSDTLLTGLARLELLDAITLQPVDKLFQNTSPVQDFTIKAGQSTVVAFPIQVPHHYPGALTYRVSALAGNFSDGEENMLPVLTNTTLITATMPLNAHGMGQYDFTFEKLLHSDTSHTLQHHALTVEYSGNPAWYAVQALPYLMEYPYESAEQVFNRYYANALATYITGVAPGIKTIFDKWRSSDTTALQSNLQKNEELKSILLQQTPWVIEAKNEGQQKKNIALLFEGQRMQHERKAALDQLAAKQQPGGAFSWFTGMWEDRFITQYILAGMGRLEQMSALKDPLAMQIVEKAIGYLDKQLEKDFYFLVKNKADLKAQHISELQIHYLYARSYFKHPVPESMRKVFEYFNAQQQQYWPKLSRYAQGMVALCLYKNKDELTPKAILKSLKENAINNEMGMYWKEVIAGYGWQQAPVETQALLIEAFDVIGKEPEAVAAMKTWLLKNKQTNNWRTTKATADACYALLCSGSNWLAATPRISIQLGNDTIVPAAAETGVGYFKKRIAGEQVKPGMGHILVTVQDGKEQPSWGAVYWQYFETLNKVTAAKTPLMLEKELFKEVNTDKGPLLTHIKNSNDLKVGDKVKVRIILRAERPMEYIHLKDMRAACFEPVNVISGSKWQNGFSYYESTKDATTDFFFSYLPAGTHIFEYAMFVTHPGQFSNGISSAQCLYAPEFSAHSEAQDIIVSN